MTQPTALAELLPQDAAIWTRDLGRRFGDTTAVTNVDLSVPRGTIFGFIGPSGSGKTTTMRLLTGDYAPSDGEIYVLGQPPARFDRRQRARIGYMPQLFVLYPHLSVWENLNFVASIYGMGLRRRRERFKQVLDFVELSGHTRKLARDISGGMQRRLSLAALLVTDPELAFLDEPTAGIDPVLRRKFWSHFGDLKAQGRTLFITTQYVGEAAYCDYVGVLSNGRLLTVDTPDGLRNQAFGGDIINLATEEPLSRADIHGLQTLDFVRRRVQLLDDLTVRLTVNDAATDITQILAWCNSHAIQVVSIEEFQPPFDDVFVKLVSEVTPVA